jgi:hypothetical protein
MVRLRILAYGAFVLTAFIFFFGREPSTVYADHTGLREKSWLTNSSAPAIPPEHRRPPDQTFLTYPEWFLVFAPAEQAGFFENHTATKFPFMTHVCQIWGGYGAVYDQIRDNFPFNAGYHMMIVVIATSSTVEFGLKNVYEAHRQTDRHARWRSDD